MKKFLVVLSVTICILGLSVSSMAYQSKSISEIPFIQEEDGVHKLTNVLFASKLTGTDLDLWKEIISVLQDGETANKFVVITVSPDSDTLGSIYFTLIKSSFSYSTDYGPHLTGTNKQFRSVYFLVKDSFTIPHVKSDFLSIGKESSSLTGSDRSHYILRGAAKLNAIRPLPDSAYVIEDSDYFWFQDDLGSFEEPEEPDPSSSSSPAWIPPVVSDPVIPEGDEYVFYDTKILGLFLNHVRTQIVHAANVGWLIFGFILAWHVVKRVIKAFSSR